MSHSQRVHWQPIESEQDSICRAFPSGATPGHPIPTSDLVAMLACRSAPDTGYQLTMPTAPNGSQQRSPAGDYQALAASGNAAVANAFADATVGGPASSPSLTPPAVVRTNDPAVTLTVPPMHAPSLLDPSQNIIAPGTTGNSRCLVATRESVSDPEDLVPPPEVDARFDILEEERKRDYAPDGSFVLGNTVINQKVLRRYRCVDLTVEPRQLQPPPPVVVAPPMVVVQAREDEESACGSTERGSKAIDKSRMPGRNAAVSIASNTTSSPAITTIPNIAECHPAPGRILSSSYQRQSSNSAGRPIAISDNRTFYRVAGTDGVETMQQFKIESCRIDSSTSENATSASYTAQTPVAYMQEAEVGQPADRDTIAFRPQSVTIGASLPFSISAACSGGGSTSLGGEEASRIAPVHEPSVESMEQQVSESYCETSSSSAGEGAVSPAVVEVNTNTKPRDHRGRGTATGDGRRRCVESRGEFHHHIHLHHYCETNATHRVPIATNRTTGYVAAADEIVMRSRGDDSYEVGPLSGAQPPAIVGQLATPGIQSSHDSSTYYPPTNQNTLDFVNLESMVDTENHFAIRRATNKNVQPVSVIDVAGPGIAESELRSVDVHQVVGEPNLSAKAAAADHFSSTRGARTHLRHSVATGPQTTIVPLHSSSISDDSRGSVDREPYARVGSDLIYPQRPRHSIRSRKGVAVVADSARLSPVFPNPPVLGPHNKAEDTEGKSSIIATDCRSAGPSSGQMWDASPVKVLATTQALEQEGASPLQSNGHRRAEGQYFVPSPSTPEGNGLWPRQGIENAHRRRGNSKRSLPLSSVEESNQAGGDDRRSGWVGEETSGSTTGSNDTGSDSAAVAGQTLLRSQANAVVSRNHGSACVSPPPSFLPSGEHNLTTSLDDRKKAVRHPAVISQKNRPWLFPSSSDSARQPPGETTVKVRGSSEEGNIFGSQYPTATVVGSYRNPGVLDCFVQYASLGESAERQLVEQETQPPLLVISLNGLQIQAPAIGRQNEYQFVTRATFPFDPLSATVGYPRTNQPQTMNFQIGDPTVICGSLVINEALIRQLRDNAFSTVPKVVSLHSQRGKVGTLGLSLSFLPGVCHGRRDVSPTINDGLESPPHRQPTQTTVTAEINTGSPSRAASDTRFHPGQQIVTQSREGSIDDRNARVVRPTAPLPPTAGSAVSYPPTPTPTITNRPILGPQNHQYLNHDVICGSTCLCTCGGCGHGIGEQYHRGHQCEIPVYEARRGSAVRRLPSQCTTCRMHQLHQQQQPQPPQQPVTASLSAVPCPDDAGSPSSPVPLESSTPPPTVVPVQTYLTSVVELPLEEAHCEDGNTTEGVVSVARTADPLEHETKRIQLASLTDNLAIPPNDFNFGVENAGGRNSANPKAPTTAKSSGLPFTDYMDSKNHAQPGDEDECNQPDVVQPLPSRGPSIEPRNQIPINAFTRRRSGSEDDPGLRDDRQRTAQKSQRPAEGRDDDNAPQQQQDGKVVVIINNGIPSTSLNDGGQLYGYHGGSGTQGRCHLPPGPPRSNSLRSPPQCSWQKHLDEAVTPEASPCNRCNCCCHPVLVTQPSIRNSALLSSPCAMAQVDCTPACHEPCHLQVRPRSGSSSSASYLTSCPPVAISPPVSSRHRPLSRTSSSGSSRSISSPVAEPTGPDLLPLRERGRSRHRPNGIDRVVDSIPVSLPKSRQHSQPVDVTGNRPEVTHGQPSPVDNQRSQSSKKISPGRQRASAVKLTVIRRDNVKGGQPVLPEKPKNAADRVKIVVKRQGRRSPTPLPRHEQGESSRRSLARSSSTTNGSSFTLPHNGKKGAARETTVSCQSRRTGSQPSVVDSTATASKGTAAFGSASTSADSLSTHSSSHQKRLRDSAQNRYHRSVPHTYHLSDDPKIVRIKIHVDGDGDKRHLR